MDIRVMAILDLIKSQDGMKNAVVAGGSVRDFKLNLIPRDYDFFVPYNRKIGLGGLQALIEEKLLKKEQEVVDKGEEYSNVPESFKVFNFKYDDIEVDVIGVDQPDDEEFGTNLVETFNYGLNMAYFDGNSIDEENEAFQRDLGRGEMTLINLRDFNELPKTFD